MSTTVYAGNVGFSETYNVAFGKDEPVPTRDLFDVLVYGANKIELVPRTELAKSLLAMWLACDIQPALMFGMAIGADPKQYRYGVGVKAMSITFRSRPMLVEDDDPYATGRHLTPDNLAACKALLEKRAAARDREYRKQRKETASPTKAKTKAAKR